MPGQYCAGAVVYMVLGIGKPTFFGGERNIFVASE